MRKRSGFTLIELLVVIAIIALLMAILMPALSRVKKQAQMVTCRARLREWGLVFKLYTDDYDGYFNEGWAYTQHHSGGTDEMGLWMNALRPYYKDNWDMLKCPTATRLVESAADWGTFKAWFRDVDMVGGGSYVYEGSYSINSWTNYTLEGRDTSRPDPYFWKNVQSSARRNEIPVFGDSTWHDAWPQKQDNPPVDPDVFGWGSPGTTDEMCHFCINRHNGFINILFMDWSTRKVGLKELWRLRWHRYWWRDPNGNWSPGPWTKEGGVLPENWPQWMRRFKDY